ncbi:hypothetical protein T12_1893 [Trichinella patagoniensis]|uniref:Uncharacterized protein n=1 Tax=Trichinella patagoniensis TaxID=990121 RepID=A0A0V0YY40_9BILA|nr:hypothetical protein T12_1893 [Trichinella patagoniensis]
MRMKILAAHERPINLCSLVADQANRKYVDAITFSNYHS